MNLQELIKEHDLKAGDEVLCVEDVEPFKGNKYTLEYIFPFDNKAVLGVKHMYVGDNGQETFVGEYLSEFCLPKQKPTPHKHHKEIKAWADGCAIQYWNITYEHWKTLSKTKPPLWLLDAKYRVKPDHTKEIDILEDNIRVLQARVAELKR